jgi:hypothetical protein
MCMVGVWQHMLSNTDHAHNKTLTSMTVIIERISWLINVTDNNDARWKPEIRKTILYILAPHAHITIMCSGLNFIMFI